MKYFYFSCTYNLLFNCRMELTPLIFDSHEVNIHSDLCFAIMLISSSQNKDGTFYVSDIETVSLIN